MLVLYKKRGETPLECLEKFRKENEKYRHSVLSYAGRLDPLAYGILLVLVDEENKDREKYINLPKTYIVEILWGISTDTFDVLGKIVSVKNMKSFLDKNILKKELNSFVGKIKQKYPPYSSKTVLGKPLFEWAREGRLNEIKIPENEVEVYSLDLLNERSLSKEDLSSEVIKMIDAVSGDFRQKEIKDLWQNFFVKTKLEQFFISTIKISCSSGVYMRKIASDLGERFGCGALAFSIFRESVGQYNKPTL